MTTIKAHHTVAPLQMRRVILESPFAGHVESNIEYARACIRDSLLRGEAPLASHLLYTQPGILDGSLLVFRIASISGFDPTGPQNSSRISATHARGGKLVAAH